METSEHQADLLLLPITEIGGAEEADVGELDRLLSCQRSKVAYLNVDSGQIIPLRCKAHRCPYCGPKNAVLLAMAQARSEPARSIRFSNLPHDWQGIRQVLKQIREAIRDAGYQNEWAFSVEPNPSGEKKCHAHGVQHGDYLPQRWLQGVCQRNGAGIPYVEAIRGGEATARYGLKAAGAAFYGVKATRETQEVYGQFLELNGGRLSHHTRGFYRSAVTGARLTQGEAVAELVAEHQNGDGEKWVVIPRDLSPQSVEAIRCHVLAGQETSG